MVKFRKREGSPCERDWAEGRMMERKGRRGLGKMLGLSSQPRHRRLLSREWHALSCCFMFFLFVFLKVTLADVWGPGGEPEEQRQEPLQLCKTGIGAWTLGGMGEALIQDYLRDRRDTSCEATGQHGGQGGMGEKFRKKERTGKPGWSS